MSSTVHAANGTKTALLTGFKYRNVHLFMLLQLCLYIFAGQ